MLLFFLISSVLILCKCVFGCVRRVHTLRVRHEEIEKGSGTTGRFWWRLWLLRLLMIRRRLFADSDVCHIMMVLVVVLIAVGGRQGMCRCFHT